MQGNFGELLLCEKSKYGAGKSSTTYKQLKRIRYIAYFYKEEEKTMGLLSDNKTFTHWHIEHKKKDMLDYLKNNGYVDYTIID